MALSSALSVLCATSPRAAPEVTSPCTPNTCFPSPHPSNIPLAMTNLYGRLQSIVAKMNLFRGLPKTMQAAERTGVVLQLTESINKDLGWFEDARSNVRPMLERVSSAEQRALLQKQFSLVMERARAVSIKPGEFAFDMRATEVLPEAARDPHEPSIEQLLLDMIVHYEAVKKHLTIFRDFQLDIATAVSSGEIEVVSGFIRRHIEDFDYLKIRCAELMEHADPLEREVLQKQYNDIVRKAAYFANYTVYFNFERRLGTYFTKLDTELANLKRLMEEYRRTSRLVNTLKGNGKITSSVHEISSLFSVVIQETKEANRHSSHDVLRQSHRERLERLRDDFNDCSRQLVIMGILKTGEISLVPCFCSNVNVVALQELLGRLSGINDEDLERNSVEFHRQVTEGISKLPDELQRRIESCRSPHKKNCKHFVLDMAHALDRVLEISPEYRPALTAFVGTPYASASRVSRWETPPGAGTEGGAGAARDDHMSAAAASRPKSSCHVRWGETVEAAAASRPKNSCHVRWGETVEAAAAGTAQMSVAPRAGVSMWGLGTAVTTDFEARSYGVYSEINIHNIRQEAALMHLEIQLTNLINNYLLASVRVAPTRKDIDDLIEAAKMPGTNGNLDPELVEAIYYHYENYTKMSENGDVPDELLEVKNFIDAVALLRMEISGL